MLNKLKAFMGSYRGEAIVCAVSGGADSMALLWGLYLLKDKLNISLSAAHFNHHLRGEESNRDEAFVRDFCAGYGIEFVSGSGQVVTGKKGLEAAAREARYAFLKSLPGRIATAHTADDNAETILMHLVRGTGLKGLGGIAPVNGNLIRPMLHITRQEVLEFLQEYSIPYVEDSSNGEDDFLRNRLRHNVMPLLKQENPSLSLNLSAMAERLRQDEQALTAAAEKSYTDDVHQLRELAPAIRSRVLSQMLLDAGVKEPEGAHIAAMESLVYSQNPSARVTLPNGVAMARNYDTLKPVKAENAFTEQVITCPGAYQLPGIKLTCFSNESDERTKESFAFTPKGKMVLRSRKTGDTIRLLGGTKSLKKLFIDEKIPAEQRDAVPVLADDGGVIAVIGIGGNLDRLSGDGTVRIQITKER
ncbi:MAG: tRNA lysidine(34) synthetase TilS [Oscillospiraceae bacterium]|nr:tRNA lysidine(34) synthetase TilS [Oscillospiraceae bacterium]